MTEILDLRETCTELKVEGKIKEFFSLPEENDLCYKSVRFYCCGASWTLMLYPNGQTENSTEGWVSLYLFRNSFGAPVTLEFTLGLKAVDGSCLDSAKNTHTFDYKHKGYGYLKFIRRSSLQEKLLELSATDTLTVFCTLKNSQQISVTGSLYSRLQDVSDNLLDIFRNEEKTDVELKFDDGNLRAHRMIVETRSPVFAAMFRHDTKEKRTGEIGIEGVEKNTMEIILKYMYSGDIDNLETKNVLSIYSAADKYDIKSVKEMCINFITLNLSKECVCDIIKFAEQYQEYELGLHAREYFKMNAGEIIETDNWETFKKENKDLGLELMTTAIKFCYSNK